MAKNLFIYQNSHLILNLNFKNIKMIKKAVVKVVLQQYPLDDHDDYGYYYGV